MGTEKCKLKAKYLVKVESLGMFQMCRMHFERDDIQRMKGIGIISVIEVDNIQGGCDGVIHLRKVGKGVPQGEVVK